MEMGARKVLSRYSPSPKTSICQVFLCEIVSFQINRLIIKAYSNTQYFYFMHSYMTQEKSFFIQARQPEAKPRVWKQRVGELGLCIPEEEFHCMCPRTKGDPRGCQSSTFLKHPPPICWNECLTPGMSPRSKAGWCDNRREHGNPCVTPENDDVPRWHRCLLRVSVLSRNPRSPGLKCNLQFWKELQIQTDTLVWCCQSEPDAGPFLLDKYVWKRLSAGGMRELLLSKIFELERQFSNCIFNYIKACSLKPDEGCWSRPVAFVWLCYPGVEITNRYGNKRLLKIFSKCFLAN